MRAFHFMPSKYAFQVLRNMEIKVSRFDDLNDPFELYGVELSNPAHRRSFKAFKRWASQRFGLLCFSCRWRNPLLWSHYGDRHRGVALEFQLDDDVVAEVEYSTYRLRLDIKRKLASGGFSEEDAYQMAITKSKHWKYEEEVRVFVKLSDCRIEDGRHFEKLGGPIEVVGVVLGPLCTLSLREIEQALPKGHELQVSRSRLAFKSFNVVKDKPFTKRLIHGAA